MFFQFKLPDQIQIPFTSSKTPQTQTPSAETVYPFDNSSTISFIVAIVLTAVLSSLGVGRSEEEIISRFSLTSAALISVPPMSIATTYLTEEVYLLMQNNRASQPTRIICVKVSSFGNFDR